MTMFEKRITVLVVLFLTIFSFFTVASCSSENTARLFDDLKSGRYDYFLETKKSVYRNVEKMGQGSAYYVGLHLKQAGYTDAAHFYFNRGVQSYEGLFKELCRNELYTTGSLEDRLSAVEDRYAAASAGGEMSDEEEKELELLRCNLLMRLKRYDDMRGTAERWYRSDTITQDIAAGLKETDMIADSYLSALTDVRIAVFEKNYAAAWKCVEKAEVLKHNVQLIAFQPVLSAIGKAAVYGAADKRAAAAFFEQLISQTKTKRTRHKITPAQQKLILFYAHFYAARVYSRAGTPFLKKAADLFYHATAYAGTNADFDAALWYYLDTLRSLDRNLYSAAVENTALLWKDPRWYRDVVEDVQNSFLAKKDWASLHRLYLTLKKTDMIDQEAEAAYILVRSGFLSKESADEMLQNLYGNKAVPLYYRLLAAYHLGISKDFAFDIFEAPQSVSEESAELTEREAVLDGLLAFGLYRRVYPQAAAFGMRFSQEKAAAWSEVLAQQGFHADSIKIAALGQPPAQDADAYLKRLYPRPWKKPVKKYAAEFGIPEYVLYAVIRSESFFNAAALSGAGAVGLTQLMPSTAADVARKLKVSTYDLQDPETNIRFGAFYLAEMIRRSDNRLLPACCSYNAGISQVRRWRRRMKELPADIFLECIPFKETRNYGKKILKTAAVYAYLYYGKQPETVIKEFFSF